MLHLGKYFSTLVNKVRNLDPRRELFNYVLGDKMGVDCFSHQK
jgi:hypothetical protein